MPDYKLIASQVASLAEIDRDFVPVLSNAAALLYEGLERINWAGFYLLACVRIAIGKGVCGTAVQEGKPLRVEDVHAFPGHIACDSASRSEIVLPIRSGGQIVGVLDIDSPEKGRFTEEDQQGLAQVVKALEESTDFSRLRME